MRYLWQLSAKRSAETFKERHARRESDRIRTFAIIFISLKYVKWLTLVTYYIIIIILAELFNYVIYI